MKRRTLLGAAVTIAGLALMASAGALGFASRKAASLAFVEGELGNRNQARAWALESVFGVLAPRTLMLSAGTLARHGFLDRRQLRGFRQMVTQRLFHGRNVHIFQID